MTDVGTFNIGFQTDVATLINGMNRAANAVTQGSNRIQRQLDSAARSTRNLIAGFASLATVRAIGKISDDYTNLSNRLRVVAKDQRDFETSLAGVAKISRETYSSLTGTAQTYSRLVIATKDLGATQEQVLGMTRALNQSFRISGATAEETSAASIQLAQGLASGALKGDELRSVLEGNAVLANLLAKELHTNVGALIDMAAEGKLTADVVGNVLLKNLDDLNAQAAKIAPTFAQSFGNVRAQFALGFGSKTNEDLQSLSSSIDQSSDRAFQFGRLMGDVTNQVVGFGREVGKITSYLADLVGGWNTFGFAVKTVMNSIKLAILVAQEAVLVLTERMYTLIDETVKAGAYIGSLGGSIGPLADYKGDVEGLKVLRAGIRGTAQDILDLSSAQQQLTRDMLAVNSFKGVSGGGKIVSSEPFGPPAPLGKLKPPSGGGTGAVGSSGGGEDSAKKIRDVVDQLKFRNEQITRGAKEQEIYNQVRAAGVSLESAAGQQIKALVDQQFELQQAQRVSAEERSRYTEMAIKMADDYKAKLDAQADAYRQLDNIVEKSVRGQIKSWRDLGQAVLEEVQNIISAQIRASSQSSGSGLIGGLIKAGLSFFGGGGGSSVQSIANPNIAGTSYLLPAYARGGITSGPSLAGEAGRPEAVVPLPDGKSIPVDLGGSGAGGVHVDYMDLRGASSEAVALAFRKIDELRADVPRLAIGATQDHYSRNPRYMR